MAAQVMGLGETAVTTIQVIFSLAAVAVVFWAYRLGVNRALATAALAVAAMLVTPQAFVYDMTVVSVAVILVYRATSGTGCLVGESAVLALAWLLPLLVKALAPSGWPVGPVVLTALLVYIVVRLQRSARTGNSTGSLESV